MGGLQIIGTKREVVAQVEAQVHVYIVVGGLKIAGTKSEMAAQIEVQVRVCIVVVGWAKDCGHEKRSGSAGRGTSAFVCIVVGGWATDSRHVDGLRIAGTQSEMAAHVEAQVHVWA